VLQIVNMSGNVVRIEKLGTDNYEVWCGQMRCFLIHNKLWHAVSFEPTAKPSKADADHACALILLHVDVMHFATIQHMTNAVDVWDALAKSSRGVVYARRLRLRRELHHSVMSGGESVQV
jgi:hypothetical protein